MGKEAIQIIGAIAAMGVALYGGYYLLQAHAAQTAANAQATAVQAYQNDISQQAMINQMMPVVAGSAAPLTAAQTSQIVTGATS